jgi:hypothetical protein
MATWWRWPRVAGLSPKCAYDVVDGPAPTASSVAHFVGPQADEVINLFGLAIRWELIAKLLWPTIFGYMP